MLSVKRRNLFHSINQFKHGKGLEMTTLEKVNQNIQSQLLIKFYKNMSRDYTEMDLVSRVVRTVSILLL